MTNFYWWSIGWSKKNGTVNLDSNSCERREYAFMVLSEYLIIFLLFNHNKLKKKKKHFMFLHYIRGGKWTGWIINGLDV